MNRGIGFTPFTSCGGCILGVDGLLDIRTVTPPGIALILAATLVYTGYSMNRPEMVIAGWVFLAVAVFLQIAYLMLRNWRPSTQTGRGGQRIRRALFRLLVEDLPSLSERIVFEDRPYW